MSVTTNTAAPMQSCPHCGLIHHTTCPRIKAIEYHADGSTKRIEFHAPQPVISSLPAPILCGSQP